MVICGMYLEKWEKKILDTLGHFFNCSILLHYIDRILQFAIVEREKKYVLMQRSFMNIHNFLKKMKKVIDR